MIVSGIVIVIVIATGSGIGIGIGIGSGIGTEYMNETETRNGEEVEPVVLVARERRGGRGVKIAGIGIGEEMTIGETRTVCVPSILTKDLTS